MVPVQSIDGTYTAVKDASIGPAFHNHNGKLQADVITPAGFANLLELQYFQSPGTLRKGLECLPHIAFDVNRPDYPTERVTTIEIPHRLASYYNLLGQANGEKGVVETMVRQKASEVGLAAAVGYFDPNSLLMGYLFTNWDNVNVNISAGSRNIQGSIKAFDVTRVKGAGVSKDPILPSNEYGQLQGAPATLSSKGLGHIPLNSGHSFISDDVRLSAWVLYKQIDRLPVSSELKTLVASLGEFQLASLLSDDIYIRTGCNLFPINEEDGNYEVDEYITKVQKACEACLSKGVINPNTVETFELNIKAKKASKK